jgi:hypothetical protein
MAVLCCVLVVLAAPVAVAVLILNRAGRRQPPYPPGQPPYPPYPPRPYPPQSYPPGAEAVATATAVPVGHPAAA